MTGLVPADAVTVAAGGAAEIGSAVLTVLGAVLTVLTDTALAVGSLVMLCAVLLALALAAGRRYGRRHPVIAPPEPGDDALAEFGGLADAEIERHLARWSRQQGGGRG